MWCFRKYILVFGNENKILKQECQKELFYNTSGNISLCLTIERTMSSMKVECRIAPQHPRKPIRQIRIPLPETFGYQISEMDRQNWIQISTRQD